MIRVGQKLHDERVQRGLALEDVAKATKIKAAFLSAIEKGEYKKLPSVAYAMGFVRNYVAFLGLPESETLALFRREFDEKKVFEVLPESLSRGREFSSNPFKLHQSVVIGIIILLGLLGYIVFQYKYAFISPALVVDTPKEKEVSHTSDILVSGKADQNATVYVNNIAVTIDQNGAFKKTISLFSGKQTLVVKAVNRFGKETTVERRIEIKSGS